MKRVTPMQVSIYDLSGGIVGNVSTFKLGPKPWLVRGDNLIFSPARGVRVRPGSRELSTARLASQPHSISKWLQTGGTRKTFVGHGTGISELTASAVTAQTLPLAFSGKPIRFTQQNDVMFACEAGGGHRPAVYLGPGSTWHQSNLQAPASPGIAAAAGGAVDAGTHYYRARNRYVNGCSLATAATPTNLVIAPGTQTVQVTGLPTTAPSSRPDWLGWVLERTKANDPLGASGTYYEVATGTTAAYNDAAADTSLWEIMRDTWYTPPGNFNGMIAMHDRLFGWVESFLYPSWEIGTAQARYAGIYNFYPLDVLRVGADDGDSIVSATGQSGRMVVFKSGSMHFVEGVDPLSFQVISVPDSSGVAGPRCCCTVAGSNVIHYNQDGLFITRASRPEAFGWGQIGHYLDEVNPVRRDRVCLFNIGNRFFVMSYSANGSTVNNEAIVYDFHTRTWTHWVHFYVEDAYVQRDADFSDARILTADGRDLDSSDYNCFAVLDGLRDDRAPDGTGGTSRAFMLQYPEIDGGDNERFKELNRVQATIEGSATDATVYIESDEGRPFLFTADSRSSGKDWCEDVATHPDDLEWDVGDWAEDEQVGSGVSGIPGGMLGTRFKLKISGQTAEESGVRGVTIDGFWRPERRKG